MFNKLKKFWQAQKLRVISVTLLSVIAISGYLNLGATYARSVGLLPSTAVVFASGESTNVDRVMAFLMYPVYGNRIGICDGTADDVEINAAIDACSASGGQVLLAGTQFYTTAAINISKAIEIKGQGRITVVHTSADINLFNVTAHDVTIRDMKLTSDHATPTNSAIKFTGCNNPQVSKVIISGYKEGIYNIVSAASLFGMLVEGCTIYGQKNGGHCIRISGSAAFGNGGAKIIGNHFSGTAARLTDQAIYLENNTLYVDIIGNHFDDTLYDCIYILGTTTACQHITIVGNDFERPGRDGISVASSKHITIGNNAIESANLTTSRYGIILNACSKSSITGGTVTLMGQHGVVVTNGCSYIDIIGLSVTNNSKTTTDTYDGLNINNGSYITVIGGQYSDDQGVKTQKRGIIEWNGGGNNKIIGVTAVGNVTTPISVSNATTTVTHNNGYVTENSGTATVANTTTSIVVNHGLATTPTRVFISLTNNPTNDPQVWWVDTLTATQFTINTKVDPGATGAIFNWRAVTREGN